MVTLERTLPLLTFILGGGLWSLILKLWDRSHPETRIRYSVRTSRIPLPTTPNLPFDTFAEVTIRNPSRRVRATNVGIAILVPTIAQLQVGEVNTPEPSGTFHLSEAKRMLSEGADYMQLELTAERLAPGSHITVPIWYLADGGELEVRGTTDQAVLARTDELDSGSIAGSSAAATLLPLLGLLAFVVLLILSQNAAMRNQKPLLLGAPETEGTGGTGKVADVIAVPTSPPTVPRLALTDGSTVRVQADPGALGTFLQIAEKRKGEFRTVNSVHAGECLLRLDSPHTELWLRAYSYNSYGDSGLSNMLRVPATNSINSSVNSSISNTLRVPASNSPAGHH